MQYTNKFNFPASIYEAISNDTYDLSKTDRQVISVTTLIEAPIIRILKLNHWNELEEDVSDSIWRLFGSAIHSVLDRVDEKEGRLKEERLAVKIGDYTISGKFDLKENTIITDYKVTSVWTVIYKDTKNWEEQLNCYAWLCRKNGHEVNKLQIIAILRDWQRNEARKDFKYPQLPLAIIDIPLWSLEEQERYVNERLKFHAEADKLNEDKLPVCTPEERWQTQDKWAVYNGNKKKALRVWNTEKEAIDFKVAYLKQYPKTELTIEKREGQAKRCLDYCLVKDYCAYGKALSKEEL